ncbi:MAG: LysM peptidoglycan-binding domain-containing protein [Cyanobacteria bacterium P01_D01_bin.1]
MITALQSTFHFLWEPLLDVPMPWQMSLVFAVALFLVPLIIFRLLPWLLLLIAKSVRILVTWISSVLLWCLGLVLSGLSNKRMPAVFYIVDDFLGALPNIMTAAESQLRSAVNKAYQKRWIFQYKGWYVSPLLISALWFTRPLVKGIPVVASGIDKTISTWCAFEHWSMTGEWKPSPLTCNRPQSPSTWHYTLKETEYRYRRDIVAYTQQITENPTDIEAHYSRAVRYLDLLDINLAYKGFTRTVEINPNHAPGYAGRGDVYLKLKDPDAALKEFTKAISVAPDYAPSYVGKGAVLRQKGSAKPALEAYEKAIELNSRYGQAYLERGMLRCEQFGDEDAAQKDYKTALDIFKEEGAQNRYDEVLEYMERLSVSYTVQQNDWLSKIAENQGVSVDQIIRANKAKYPSLLSNSDSISTGWTLDIPQCT